jgi:hypothetical protein
MKKFLIVLFISLIIIAFFVIPRSDTLSQLSYDDIKGMIFSYNRENENESRIELLGLIYKIDLQKAAELSDKAGQLLSYNIDCLPEGITAAVKSLAQAITDITDRLFEDKLPALIYNSGVLL